MKLKRYIPLGAIFLLQLLACKKNGETNNNPKTSADTDVYISGVSSKGGAYWKNGTPSYLTGSFGDYNAAIALNGSDTYVAGYSLSNGTNGEYVATIWKNGVETQLDEGADYSQVGTMQMGNIVVNGSDVYTVGSENIISTGSAPDLNIAMYWKNNVLVKLTDGLSNAYAYAIAVNGSDIYVAGSVNGDAVYWKNGNMVDLTTSTYPSDNGIAAARSIVINGNDIYFAGTTIAPNGNTVATYWKNGVAMDLTDGSTNSAINAITVSGNDVYAAGYVDNASLRTIATYWKNFAPTTLAQGTSYTQCTGIAVNGGNVYVTEIGAQCGYWKNSTFIQLADCYNISAIVIATK